MEPDIMLPVCGEPAIFMEFDVVLFMDGELPAILFGAILFGAILFGAMLFGAMLPVCGAAMLFIELVCIICGALVVIMESDIMFPVWGGLSACITSGSAKAREVNDILSLVIVFIVFIVWLLVYGEIILRAGAASRRRLAMAGVARYA